MSLVEDGLVIGMMWLATHYPVTFAVVLTIVLVLSIWLLVVLIKFLKSLVRRVKAWFGNGETVQPS